MAGVPSVNMLKSSWGDSPDAGKQVHTLPCMGPKGENFFYLLKICFALIDHSLQPRGENVHRLKRTD